MKIVISYLKNSDTKKEDQDFQYIIKISYVKKQRYKIF